MRAILITILLLASCNSPRGYVCGTVTNKVRSTITGASYAILATCEDPPVAYVDVPWAQWDSLEIGSDYCGRLRDQQ